MLNMIIVEDERIEREGLMDFLDWTCLGIQLAGTACDGIEGVELAEKVRPDIVITDVKMPGIPGTEMAKRIREFLPEVKIIILTGYDDNALNLEAEGLHITARVLKPIEEDELLEAVKAAIGN